MSEPKKLDAVRKDHLCEVKLLLSTLPKEAHQAVMSELAHRHHTLDAATRADLARQALGAPAEGFKKVEAFAHKHGLTEKSRRAVPASVTLTGTAEQVAQAFGVTLHWYGEGKSRHLGPAGEVAVPAELRGVVDHVLGLDRRPLPYERAPRATPEAASPEADAARPATPKALGEAPASPRPCLTVPELAKLYNFPPDLDGSGQKIGFVIAYGGLPLDILDQYFQALGRKTPKVTIIEMEGSTNDPAPPQELQRFIVNGGLGTMPPANPCASQQQPVGPPVSPGPYWDKQLLFTLEALLDAEVLGSVAPGAELRVYVTTFDMPGLQAAIEKAADEVDVLVLAWGFAETTQGPTFLDPIDQALKHAMTQGVTVLCASGDLGSAPNPYRPKEAQVSFPACSAYVVACGGTALLATTPTAQGGPPEAVWNEQVPTFGHLATGGGFSTLYERPAWQKIDSSETGRAVPDISANARHATGVWVWFNANGSAMGTSAAVGLMGGLVALINQALGRRVGFLTPLLYEPSVREAMQQIAVPGNNIVKDTVSVYEADPRASWNPCTGLGTPDGTKLLAALREVLGSRETAHEPGTARAPAA